MEEEKERERRREAEELRRIIFALGDVKEDDFADLPAHFVVTESLQRPKVHKGDIVTLSRLTASDVLVSVAQSHPERLRSLRPRS